MTSDPVDFDQPAPPQASAKRRMPVVAWVFLGVLALVVGVGGFFVVRAVMIPTPEFPSLADTPDPTLTGTVAFIRSYPDECVYLVAASGGEPKKVACVEGSPGDLSWTPDGKIQATRYKGGEGTDPTASWIIDPKTGEVETVPADEIPPQSYDPEEGPEVKAPNGETVACDSSNGKLTLTLGTKQGERTLLSVDAPDTYCMRVQAWNPDGSWFLVSDDLDRTLLVTTDDPSTTRVLIDGGFDAAYTDAELLPG